MERYELGIRNGQDGKKFCLVCGVWKMSTDRWVTSSAVDVHGDAQDIYSHVTSLTSCFTVLVQNFSDTDLQNTFSTKSSLCRLQIH